MKKKKTKMLPTSIKPFVFKWFNRCQNFWQKEDISSFTSFQTIIKPYEFMYSVFSWAFLLYIYKVAELYDYKLGHN